MFNKKAELDLPYRMKIQAIIQGAIQKSKRDLTFLEETIINGYPEMVAQEMDTYIDAIPTTREE